MLILWRLDTGDADKRWRLHASEDSCRSRFTLGSRAVTAVPVAERAPCSYYTISLVLPLFQCAAVGAPWRVLPVDSRSRVGERSGTGRGGLLASLRKHGCRRLHKTQFFSTNRWV
jgi:hypothetical protein